jgi:hypothetical protein
MGRIPRYIPRVISKSRPPGQIQLPLSPVEYLLLAASGCLAPLPPPRPRQAAFPRTRSGFADPRASAPVRPLCRPPPTEIVRFARR